jgi:hypothetical protein
VEFALKARPLVPHCQYLFVKLEELITLHQAENKIQHPHFASFTAFLLGKTAHKKPHYKPKKLVFVRLHQQIKRYLLAASVLLAITTLGITGSNLLKSHSMGKASLQLNQDLSDNSTNIETLQSWFGIRKTSPEKMEAVVITARKLTEANPLPKPIFEIISRGYENYNDLSLNILEWERVSVSEESSNNVSSHKGMDTLEVTSSANKVLIKLEGEVLNFQGNYRQAIERIQAFADTLKNLTSVELVNVLKLPLDINPATNISRSISDQTAPAFALELQINSEAL